MSVSGVSCESCLLSHSHSESLYWEYIRTKELTEQSLDLKLVCLTLIMWLSKLCCFPLRGVLCYSRFQINFSSVQLLSSVQLFATPWTAACQASLSITNSQSLLKLMSVKSVLPSHHLILCHPLLLSVFPTIWVFSNESALRIRWPKYWEFQLQHQSFQWVFRTDFL